MARKRANPTPAKQDSKTGWIIGGVAVVGLAVVAFLVLGGDGDDHSSTGTCVPVESFPDVHGLAVAPDNGSLLYVATHHGLVRATDDTGWCRLGPIADYMGFTMHPTDGDTFWVSGHPRGGGNMGVRQSTDGGHTWQTLALEGVDFHAMTVSRADPDTLWGSYGGDIYHSRDGGHTWDTPAKAPTRFTSLVSHPTDPTIVYGVSQAGIHASGNAGRDWLLAHDRPTRAFAVHPQDPDILLAVFAEGLHRSEGDATDWKPLPLDAEGTIGHLAFSPSDPDTLYAATYEGTIHKSTDGGDTWQRVK